MTTTTDTASKANPRNIFIKKSPPTKILIQRTSGTFAFAATHKANAEAKAKEPLFPTLCSVPNSTFDFNK